MSDMGHNFYKPFASYFITSFEKFKIFREPVRTEMYIFVRNGVFTTSPGLFRKKKRSSTFAPSAHHTSLVADRASTSTIHPSLTDFHHLRPLITLAAGHSLDTAVTTAQAGTGVLVGLSGLVVESVCLARDADARVAAAEEIRALLADGEVVGGLICAGLGEAGCGGGGQDEKGCELHIWPVSL